jgi:hypothetical protein
VNTFIVHADFTELPSHDVSEEHVQLGEVIGVGNFSVVRAATYQGIPGNTSPQHMT